MSTEAETAPHCADCLVHKGIITFAASAMDYVHGMSKRLCKCCYFKRVEKAWKDTNENYAKLKAELEQAPCQ